MKVLRALGLTICSGWLVTSYCFCVAPWDQYTSSFYANSGLNSARAPASSGNSALPSEHYLISPGVDLTDGYYLKFWFDGSSSGSSSYYTNIEVLISSQNTDVTTGGLAWLDIFNMIQERVERSKRIL